MSQTRLCRGINTLKCKTLFRWYSVSWQTPGFEEKSKGELFLYRTGEPCSQKNLIIHLGVLTHMCMLTAKPYRAYRGKSLTTVFVLFKPVQSKANVPLSLMLSIY